MTALVFSLFLVWTQSGGDCGPSAVAPDAGVIVQFLELNQEPSTAPTVGQGLRFSVTAFKPDNRTIVGGITYAWTVSNPAVLRLTAIAGATDAVDIMPIAAGTSTITVTTVTTGSATTNTGQPLTLTKTLSVTAAGMPLTVATTALSDATVGTAYSFFLSAAGGPANATSLRWTISSGTLPPGFNLDPGTAAITSASVSATPGSYTFTVQANAFAAGGVTVLATATKSLTLRINPLTFTSLTVTPAGAGELFTPNTRQYIATTNTGTNVTPTATWSSSNGAVAIVSATGLVVAISPGVATISAALNGLSNSAGPLTVRSVTTIEVAPTHNLLTGGPGSAGTFTAVVRDQGGVDVTAIVPPVWSTSNAAVATLAPSGASVAVTAIASGGALITATAGGRTMSGAITVGSTFGAIQFNVTRNAPAPTGPPANEAQLTAFSGSTVVGSGVVNCTGRAVGSLICDSGGRGYIPGLPAGTYTVTVALLGYVTQTISNVVVTNANITAVPPVVLVASPPASMTLSPPNIVVSPTNSTTYTVSLFDASGAPTAIEAGSSVGFAIDASAIATFTITPDPLKFVVTAKAAGTTVVRAFYIRNGQQTSIIASANFQTQ